MNTHILEQTLQKLAETSNHAFDYYRLKDSYYQPKTYSAGQIHAFVEDLTERALRIKLSLVVHAVTQEQLAGLVHKIDHPLLVIRTEGDQFFPIVLAPGPDNLAIGYEITEKSTNEVDGGDGLFPTLYRYQNHADPKQDGLILVIAGLPIPELVGHINPESGEPEKHLTPVQRLMRLLGNERKDIVYIYVYAIVVGLINLSLPLGIQALIGLISGGLIFSSVIILIAIIILGTLLAGSLQIMQLTIVEVLQRRVFAKASLEFAYRIPRMQTEALMEHNPPELMNRFFDVPTLQKGLPKLLIDLLAAVLQIFFGLILLSFYHPYFIFFGVLLASFVVLLFRLTGPQGLKAALNVSKYKYKLGNWFQELARVAVPFKMAGKTNMPLKKTDDYVNNWLHYRKKFFSILLTQFSWLVIFKTAITGGLLILGTMLVVDRQITLGQFVASEIVIITIVSAVEKIILNVDTVYDLLVAVEKIGHVTDVPLENHAGAHWTPTHQEGIEVEMRNVSYTLQPHTTRTLNDINLRLERGKVYSLTGTRGSGKTVLVSLMSGVLPSYDGTITIDNVSIRDMDKGALRSLIGENLVNNTVFDGTILDNLTMGRPHVTFQDVVDIAKVIKLDKLVNAMPDGYATVVREGENAISGSLEYRITLGRAMLGHPRLLVVNDLLHVFTRHEKLELLTYLTDPARGWTLLLVSEDPMVIAASHRVLNLRHAQLSQYEATKYIPE